MRDTTVIDCTILFLCTLLNKVYNVGIPSMKRILSSASCPSEAVLNSSGVGCCCLIVDV